MSNKEITDFADKMSLGLQLAERRMLEEKALHGQNIVVCSSDGEIIYTPAKKAIKKMDSNKTPHKALIYLG
ncbi:MAG: hypothetical protein IJP95_09110 [Bacteroidales bacterium]|nr:hypothetical protein [Bacteroidales bacterium]